jgi:hypothetical protein
MNLAEVFLLIGVCFCVDQKSKMDVAVEHILASVGGIMLLSIFEIQKINNLNINVQFFFPLNTSKKMKICNCYHGFNIVISRVIKNSQYFSYTKVVILFLFVNNFHECGVLW